MSKPSLLRKEMENRRIEMKSKLDAVEIELIQIPNTHFKSEESQRLNSSKRLLIKELNKLTIGIKQLAELETDENVVKQMNDLYTKLESGEMSPSDLQNLAIKIDNENEDDNEGEWTAELDNEEEDVIDDPAKSDESCANNASDTDISSAVDDLLDNL